MKYSRRYAFSLIEVTLALGVAAFALLAVFALLPIGLQTSANASEQSAATNILAAVISDLRATPSAAASSPLFGIPIPSNSAPSVVDRFFTSEGKSSDTINSDARYHVTITFTPNPSGVNAATLASIALRWPAAAKAANASGSVETFVALARN